MSRPEDGWSKGNDGARSYFRDCEVVPTDDAFNAIDRRDAEIARLRAALRRHVCQHVQCSDIETHAGCHAKYTLASVGDAGGRDDDV